MIILKKNVSSKLELLLINSSQIYYLNINLHPDMWIIKQVYLLEEIPNPNEIKARIAYYRNHESYKETTPKEAQSLLKKTLFFMSLFMDRIDHQNLKLFPDLYRNRAFYPDIKNLYRQLINTF